MAGPEEWRFQWPDGTWIYWDPRTQSWEKENPSEAVPAVPEAITAAARAAEPTPVEAPEPEPEPELVEDAPEPEPEPPAEPPVEGSPTGRRLMVDDVLPPREEPDRPGGSLWPTIVAGALVGVGVGWLLWDYIR